MVSTFYRGEVDTGQRQSALIFANDFRRISRTLTPYIELLYFHFFQFTISPALIQVLEHRRTTGLPSPMTPHDMNEGPVPAVSPSNKRSLLPSDFRDQFRTLFSCAYLWKINNSDIYDMLMFMFVSLMS